MLEAFRITCSALDLQIPCDPQIVTGAAIAAALAARARSIQDRQPHRRPADGGLGCNSRWSAFGEYRSAMASDSAEAVAN